MESGPFHLDYILLPTGYAYNTEWATAKKGDKVRLWTGGDHTIYAVRKIKLKQPAADILCRMRYGINIKRAQSIWRQNATLEGHGARAVSDEECLWVIFSNETDEQDSV